MDAHKFATGLRQIADWYEAHPDIALPADKEISVYEVEDSKERVARIIRALGSPIEKSPIGNSGLFAVSRKFNGVELRFVFYRDTVCTARVVGTRVVPAVFRPARTENILEWDCSSILGEAKQTDK